MASAPAGTGAPVKIRAASPRRDRRTDLAGSDPLGDPQRHLTLVGDVGGPHRVAVHRAVRVARHVDRRHHVRRDDPAERILDCDPLVLLDGAGAVEQIGACLLDREHGGRVGRHGFGSGVAHDSIVGIPARTIKPSSYDRARFA